MKSLADGESSKNKSGEKRVGSTAKIDALLLQGQIIAKQLDALMHNKYKSDAEKMGAWVTASHVEHQSGKKTAATKETAAPAKA